MTADDVNGVLQLCRDAVAESPQYDLADFDAKRVREKLHLALVRWALPSLNLVAVSESGEVAAFFSASVQENLIGAGWESRDNCFYIAPHRRGGILAAKIVRQYVKWARSVGVPDGSIYLGISSGIAPERTVCFYQRLGFKIKTFNMVNKGPTG